MSYLKRLCAFILSFTIVVGTSIPAFAAENPADMAEHPANTTDIGEIDADQVNAMRFENVTIDALLDFDADSLAAIEKDVGIDEFGYYYVEDEEDLRSVLTDDEYALVLEQIAASNSETVPLAAEDGSESNPYILSANTQFKTSASSSSSTWFRIDGVRGATDFKITTTKSASATIYKKTLLGKTSIATASGSSINKTISSCETNNNSNNYIINVAVSSSMTSYITVGQHTDKTTTYYTGGTVWTPYDKSAIPDTNMLVMKMWYLKAADVDKLVTFVNHDKYIQFCDDYAAGLITAAGIATTIWGSGTSGKIIGVALALIGLETSSMFKQHLLDTIDDVAGWNGSSYTKNVYMKQVFSTNLAVYSTYVYAWSGSTISGASGYTGSYSAPV